MKRLYTVALSDRINKISQQWKKIRFNENFHGNGLHKKSGLKVAENKFKQCLNFISQSCNPYPIKK